MVVLSPINLPHLRLLLSITNITSPQKLNGLRGRYQKGRLETIIPFPSRSSFGTYIAREVISATLNKTLSR